MGENGNEEESLNASLAEQGAESRKKIKKDIWAQERVSLSVAPKAGGGC